MSVPPESSIISMTLEAHYRKGHPIFYYYPVLGHPPLFIGSSHMNDFSSRLTLAKTQLLFLIGSLICR